MSERQWWEPIDPFPGYQIEFKLVPEGEHGSEDVFVTTRRDGQPYGWHSGVRAFPMKTIYIQVRGAIAALLMGQPTHEPTQTIDDDALRERRLAYVQQGVSALAQPTKGDPE